MTISVPTCSSRTTQGSKRSIVIYKDHLLPATETFIRSQAESMLRFVPHYLGSRQVPGLTLPPERTLALNCGGVLGRSREFMFKVLNISPMAERYLRALRPALIHAHFGVGGAIILPLARRLDIPLVVTFHGFD